MVTALILAASGAGLYFRTAAAKERAAGRIVPVAVPTGIEVRIAAGLKAPKYVDASGHIWSGDQHFSGGETVSRPEAKILRTLDPALYQQARTGDFRYDIPLQPGVYELHLHFAEILLQGTFAYGGEGVRRFHVSANGKRLLSDYDIANSAPGMLTADERVFIDISPANDGQLHLEFQSSAGRALLSGIELLPGTPNRMLPLRLVTRYRGHFDREGGFWGADRYSQGGTAALRPTPVEGTEEPGLYTSERFGHFSYFLPVADGSYTVTLQFAESALGLEGAGAASTGGRRVFDIFCNGTALVRELDVLRDAGAPNRALVKKFPGLRPNAQGKLDLQFVPVAEHAAVRSIEVTDERR